MQLFPKGGDQQYTVSLFGTIALAGAVMIYLFSTTWAVENVNVFFTMFLLLLAGISLSYIFVGFRVAPFNFKTLFTDILATAAAFISVFYVNQVFPHSVAGIDFSVSPVSATGFYVLSGVAEEWFFRAWLCCWVYKLTRSVFLAVPVSSFVWAIFHLARYGGSMNLIALVFVAGLPLGYLTLLFRSWDGSTFGHMIVNALARGG
jgi:hypothetical protein